MRKIFLTALLAPPRSHHKQLFPHDSPRAGLLGQPTEVWRFLRSWWLSRALVTPITVTHFLTSQAYSLHPMILVITHEETVKSFQNLLISYCQEQSIKFMCNSLFCYFHKRRPEWFGDKRYTLIFSEWGKGYFLKIEPLGKCYQKIE